MFLKLNNNWTYLPQMHYFVQVPKKPLDGKTCPNPTSVDGIAVLTQSFKRSEPEYGREDFSCSFELLLFNNQKYFLEPLNFTRTLVMYEKHQIWVVNLLNFSFIDACKNLLYVKGAGRCQLIEDEHGAQEFFEPDVLVKEDLRRNLGPCLLPEDTNFFKHKVLDKHFNFTDYMYRLDYIDDELYIVLNAAMFI